MIFNPHVVILLYITYTNMMTVQCLSSIKWLIFSERKRNNLNSKTGDKVE